MARFPPRIFQKSLFPKVVEHKGPAGRLENPGHVFTPPVGAFPLGPSAVIGAHRLIVIGDVRIPVRFVAIPVQHSLQGQPWFFSGRSAG